MQWLVRWLKGIWCHRQRPQVVMAVLRGMTCEVNRFVDFVLFCLFLWLLLKICSLAATEKRPECGASSVIFAVVRLQVCLWRCDLVYEHVPRPTSLLVNHDWLRSFAWLAEPQISVATAASPPPYCHHCRCSTVVRILFYQNLNCLSSQISKCATLQSEKITAKNWFTSIHLLVACLIPVVDSVN